ncbi:phytanoyl-CoA dioxygenase family protein [Micromonospora carbonacea]|uniref:phytanoyl-CoA dioxygenase family protein n=1 Tax=Micromonospora carbonacea TaxID=47853 RepID=UPI00331874F4
MDRREIQRRAKELEPWVNGFEFEGIRYAEGSDHGYLLSQDPADRARAFYEAFPGATRILELGALEGADTLALARQPGTSILGLEGREENLRRAEFVMEVHGATNVELRIADVETLDFATLGRFDAVLCAGLLYHVREPWALLKDAARVSNGIYLSTHYWGSSDGLETLDGYSVKHVREEHPEPQARGLSVDVRWLDRASLFAALENAGFVEIEVLHERTSAEVCDIVVVGRTRLGAQIRRFREDGFVNAGPVFADDTIARLKAGAIDLISRFTEHGHVSDDYWNYDVENEAPVLYRIHNLEKQDWAERELLFRPELAELAAAFVGSPVVPTAFALVLKEPKRAAGVPWHRDRANVAPHTVCNLSICLDTAGPENGCLEGVPGSHLLPDDIDVPEIRDGGPRVPVPSKAGDVIVHDVRLVHGSGPNPSDQWRRTIVIEFANPAISLPSLPS